MRALTQNVCTNIDSVAGEAAFDIMEYLRNPPPKGGDTRTQAYIQVTIIEAARAVIQGREYKNQK